MLCDQQLNNLTLRHTEHTKRRSGWRGYGVRKRGYAVNALRSLSDW